jgi:hypothetical protein
MAVQTLKVQVTERHIQNARPDAWRRNPVALALRDVGFRYVQSGYVAAFLSRSSQGAANGLGVTNTALLAYPKKVQGFLKRYDRLKSSRKTRAKLKPVSFVVKLTPDVEKAFSPVQHIARTPNRVFDEEVEIVLQKTS